MTGYTWRGQPGLPELNTQIIAARGRYSHGSSGYRWAKCRCPICKAANTAQQRRRRAVLRAQAIQ